MFTDGVDRGPPEEVRVVFDAGPSPHGLLPSPMVTTPYLKKILNVGPERHRLSKYHVGIKAVKFWRNYS